LWNDFAATMFVVVLAWRACAWQCRTPALTPALPGRAQLRKINTSLNLIPAWQACIKVAKASLPLLLHPNSYMHCASVNFVFLWRLDSV
jgi:hypothetical protein